nr:hypothetical protein [uncultured Carboxylicivirga sp.]
MKKLLMLFAAFYFSMIIWGQTKIESYSQTIKFLPQNSSTGQFYLGEFITGKYEISANIGGIHANNCGWKLIVGKNWGIGNPSCKVIFNNIGGRFFYKQIEEGRIHLWWDSEFSNQSGVDWTPRVNVEYQAGGWDPFLPEPDSSNRIVLETNTGTEKYRTLEVIGEITTGQTDYHSIQLATHSWAGSHGLLFNCYKSVVKDGSLRSNTKYTNDRGSYSGGAGSIFFWGNGGTLDFCISPASEGADEIIDWGDPKLRILRNGNIAIGKKTANAKLDVAGNIKAEEIEVTLASMQDLNLNGTLAANNITYTANGQTADHVFEEDYDLKSLEEIETFITENKHLPDVPSAEAMEEKGVNLAEMNKLLLQKVEELTLYAIEQEAEAKKSQAEVTILKAEIEEERKERRVMRFEMEERFIKLENILNQK